MRLRILRVVFSLAIVVAIGGGLTACGKRGDLEPPEGKKSTYPKTYPTQ